MSKQINNRSSNEPFILAPITIMCILNRSLSLSALLLHFHKTAWQKPKDQINDLNQINRNLIKMFRLIFWKASRMFRICHGHRKKETHYSQNNNKCSSLYKIIYAQMLQHFSSILVFPEHGNNNSFFRRIGTLNVFTKKNPI